MQAMFAWFMVFIFVSAADSLTAPESLVGIFSFVERAETDDSSAASHLVHSLKHNLSKPCYYIMHRQTPLCLPVDPSMLPPTFVHPVHLTRFGDTDTGK